MKLSNPPIRHTLLIAFGFFAASSVFAQSSYELLAKTCQSDIELGEFIVSLINDANANSSAFTSAERDEIVAVLQSGSVSELETGGQYQAVIAACADNSILQARHAYLTNGQ